MTDKQTVANFRHDFQLDDSAQKAITGKATVKHGDSATGDLTLKFTSSIIPHDDDEFERLITEANAAVRQALEEFRERLEIAQDLIEEATPNLFTALRNRRKPKRRKVADEQGEPATDSATAA